MDCSGGRAEAVEKVPERREETFFVGWFSGVGKRVSVRRCESVNKEIQELKKKIERNNMIIAALHVLKKEKLKELKRLMNEK